MTGCRRALRLATALCVILSGTVTTAQTVIVTRAPARSTVELALNATMIASATADNEGTASLDVNLQRNRGRTEIDARVYVDTCQAVYRVTLVEPLLQPPPPRDGCARQELVGLFLVREVTTFVIDVGGSAPTLRLRQGRAPEAWLRPGFDPSTSVREWSSAPTGLLLSGGAGLAIFGSPNASACGNVPDCSGKDAPFALTTSATFWMAPFLAAEAGYLKPRNVTARGGGDAFRFETALETDVVTIVARFGGPAGPARIYGLAGATHHWATSTTTQVIDDRVVLVDEDALTIPGGTQVFILNTKGWGWLFGGGVEFWVAPRFAIYGEFARARLKGTNADGGEGALNEGVSLILGGARVRLF